MSTPGASDPSAAASGASLTPLGVHPAALAPEVSLVAGVRAHTLGLACCAMECAAAVRLGGEVDAPEVPADVLVVAGTVTDRAAGMILQAYADLKDRSPNCRVVSFGACANTGGPYWDSYAVTKGVDQLIPVDAYVAGCPPRPEALVQALREVAERDS